MNLAFSTVLIFLILLPGTSLRLFLFYGEYSKKLTKTSVFDEFIWSLIPGLIIQLTSSWFVNSFHPFNYSIDFGTIGILFNGAKEDENIRSAFEKIAESNEQIIIYNFILIFLAGLSGFLIRKAIRGFKLDHKSQIFRFSNEWFYYLRGEFVFFKENRIPDINEIDNCFIDSLVKVGNEVYIYQGFINAFHHAKDGLLDNIVITGVRRRKINDNDYYYLPGQLMILKYCDIINIHVKVIFVPEKQIEKGKKEEESEPTPPPPPPPPPPSTSPNSPAS